MDPFRAAAIGDSTLNNKAESVEDFKRNLASRSGGDAGEEIRASYSEFFEANLRTSCSPSPSYEYFYNPAPEYHGPEIVDSAESFSDKPIEPSVSRWKLTECERFGQDSMRGPNSHGKCSKLGSPWTYWFIVSPGSEADWKDGMKPMCTFNHKEQFWGMWNAIKPPSELVAKKELALFRGGFGRRPVWPDWNDGENSEGGRWKILFKVTELPQIVDNFWRDLMVHCIEERWVPYSNFVNGVSITMKGQCYRIYIWLSASRPAYIDFVRDRTKELLKDIPCVQMEYIYGYGDRPTAKPSGKRLDAPGTAKRDFSQWINHPHSHRDISAKPLPFQNR